MRTFLHVRYMIIRSKPNNYVKACSFYSPNEDNPIEKPCSALFNSIEQDIAYLSTNILVFIISLRIYPKFDNKDTGYRFCINTHRNIFIYCINSE